MVRILINLLIIVVLAFSCNCVLAEEKINNDLLNDFDDFAEQMLNKWQVPGMSIVIVKGETPFYIKSYGVKSIDKDEKINPETLFCLGSTSKAFNGTLLALLDDEDFFDLDKPIKDIYPEFKMNDDYRTNHITLRDLLLHRSGIPGYDSVWYRSNLSSDELLKRLRFLKPNKGIREYWQYSNILFSSAGYIAANIVGSSWQDLVKEKLLVPLKMNNTGFSADELKNKSNYASPHKLKDDKIVKIPFLNTDPILPAGGMYSNVNDLANWLVMNLNDGRFDGKKIISSKMLKQVHTPQMAIISPIPFKEVGYSEYALGWAYFPYRGENLIIHEGEIDGFKTHVSFIPSKNIGLAVLCNSNTVLPSIISFDVYDRLLGKGYINWSKRFEDKQNQRREEENKVSLSPKSKVTKNINPSHPLKDYAGKYFNPLFGELEINYKDGKLTGYFREEFDIEHYQYDVFNSFDHDDSESLDMKISFFLNKDGLIEKLGLDLVPELDEDIYFTKTTDAK